MSMIDMWVARDKDNSLYVYIGRKPEKEDTIWDGYGEYAELDCSLFPEVKWSNEDPTKVKLVIEK